MKNDPWIAYVLLNYFVRQPSATDTLQGIAEWWILKEHISYTVEKISSTLDLLVSKGFVIVKEYHNQEKHYKLNEEKLSEIKKALREMENYLSRNDTFMSKELD
ncbi:MAG: hypothetical protein ACE5IW_07235 [bacterium]